MLPRIESHALTMLAILFVLVLPGVGGCTTRYAAEDTPAGMDAVATHEPASEEQAMEDMGMSQYIVGFLYRGPTWTPEVTDEVMRMQEAHLANIGRLAEEGTLILAGPFGDDTNLRGLFFFDVATIEEAERLCATDPAVAAGRLRVELHPWWATSALKHLPDVSG